MGADSDLQLGVNIDHVATLRNARSGDHPSILAAARIARDYGADGITVHLREDRRHIRDQDVADLLQEGFRLNLEMAPTEEMTRIVESFFCKSRIIPAVCLVPEKREEQTTEGGLDVVAETERLTPIIARLRDCATKVALFVEPDLKQLDAAKSVGAHVVELHTGEYANTNGRHAAGSKGEALQSGALLLKLQQAAQHAERLGLRCHAGHGLDFDNVAPVAAIPQVCELNIGYFLIGQALFDSLGGVVKKMKRLMTEARSGNKTASH